MAKSANRPKSEKRKPPRTAWKKGQSGNPTGRPKDGESWSGVIKDVANMTAEEILNLIGKENDLGKQIAQLPKGVQVKYLVTARVITSLMFEPSAGLWNGLMDRMDGKVPDKLKFENLPVLVFRK